jgi:phospholipase/carboxylesterase
MLTAIEIETGDNPTHAIIWLHGLGADGHDFVPIVDELDLPSKKRIRFIFPHAPERPVTINGGYVMRAWYDIYHADFNHRQDESGIRESQQAIDALIIREQQRGIPTQHIFLAGFSQGGAMALQTGLRQAQPLSGIIALSCYLPLVETLATEASPSNASIPILMTHGINDPVIPIAYAIASKDELLAAHYQVDWHQYLMAHTVCGPEIADISYWLQRLVDHSAN